MGTSCALKTYDSLSPAGSLGGKAFKLMSSGMRRGILFNGALYESETFFSSLLATAARRIAIVDDIVDDTVLRYLEELPADIRVTIYTSAENLIIRHDVSLHNKAHHRVSLKFCRKSHDNYLVVDNTVYSSGASFNHIGRRLIRFYRAETINADRLLDRLDFE